MLDYGSRQYELADHLGNVSVVLSGRRLLNTIATDFTANVLSANEYYPFGMVMPNRTFSSESYRYGFQGQEKDDEVKGSLLAHNLTMILERGFMMEELEGGQRLILNSRSIRENLLICFPVTVPCILLIRMVKRK